MKHSILKLTFVFSILISSFICRGQNAEKELERIFANKHSDIKEKTELLELYTEIESGLILNNDQKIIQWANAEELTHKIDLYNVLSNAAWYRNNKEKATNYLNIVDSLLHQKANYFKGEAYYLRTLGLMQVDKNNKDSALFYLSKANEMALATNNTNLIAKSYYSIGFCYWDLTDITQALRNFKKAEEYFTAVNASYELARIYNYYALNNQRIGDLAAALDQFLIIEDIYRVKDDERRVADVLRRIGSVYYDLERYNDALSAYNNALNIYEKLKLSARISTIYGYIGEVFIKLENYNTAKEYFIKSIKLEEEHGNKLRTLGAKLNMVDIYIHENRLNAALNILNEALDVYQKLNYADGIATINNQIAEIYLKQGLYNKAIEKTKTALTLSKTSKSASLIRDTYLQLSKIYEKKNDNTLALENYKFYKMYSDSILNSETLLRVENIKSKYELDKMEQEFNRLQTDSEIRKQKYQLFLLLGIIVLLAILFIFYYIRSKDRIKHLAILTEKNKALQDANKKIEESNKFRKRLIANISHEIRTPLNIILGLTSLIEKDTEPDVVKEYIDEIKNSSNNLTKMIDSMLIISMLESNQLKVNKKEFSSELLKKEVDLYLSNREIKKDIQISVNCSDDFVIFSDKLRTVQILEYLIDNAIKFTQKGAINISIHQDKDNLKVSVKDSGEGIYKNRLNEIFDLFNKSESTSNNYRGAGLGLYIVKKISILLNGHINVVSEPGNGSEFTLSIPLL